MAGRRVRDQGKYVRNPKTHKTIESYGNAIDPETRRPWECPSYDENPEAARTWAKQEYMRGKFAVKHICEWTGVPYDTFIYWVKVGDPERHEEAWALERGMAVTQAVQGVAKQMKGRLQYVIAQLIFIAEQTIQRYLEMNHEFTLEELKGVVTMLGKMQEVYNLQIGEPTKIFGLKIDSTNQQLTWEEVVQRIRTRDVINQGLSLVGVRHPGRDAYERRRGITVEAGGEPADPSVPDGGSAGGATCDTEEGTER